MSQNLSTSAFCEANPGPAHSAGPASLGQHLPASASITSELCCSKTLKTQRKINVFALGTFLGPKMAHKIPKMTTKTPKMALRTFQDGLQDPQDGPHDPQDGPQEPARWPPRPPTITVNCNANCTCSVCLDDIAHDSTQELQDGNQAP